MRTDPVAGNAGLIQLYTKFWSRHIFQNLHSPPKRLWLYIYLGTYSKYFCLL